MASVAGRVASSIVRRSFNCCVWRKTCIAPTLQSNTTSMLRRFHHSTISSTFRRESLILNSLLPIHTATASARLVSKLPSESNVSAEGCLCAACFEILAELDASVWNPKGLRKLLQEKQHEGHNSSPQCSPELLCSAVRDIVPESSNIGLLLSIASSFCASGRFANYLSPI